MEKKIEEMKQILEDITSRPHKVKSYDYSWEMIAGDTELLREVTDYTDGTTKLRITIFVRDDGEYGIACERMIEEIFLAVDVMGYSLTGIYKSKDAVMQDIVLTFNK